MALRVRVKFEDDAKLHEAIANGRDEDGNTLYHHASRSGCIHLLNALGRSSEIHMKNSLGQTALHLADSASCFKWLIDNGAEVNVPDMNGQTPIFQASSLEVLSVLLNHGAKVDMKDAMNNTPMHYMLMRSQLPDPACLRLLLHAGADVNSQNHKLWTPLFYCAFAGSCTLSFRFHLRARFDLQIKIATRIVSGVLYCCFWLKEQILIWWT